MARPLLSGWSSKERLSASGAVEFEQRVTATRPLVELSESGALSLADRYWDEVEAVTRGLVRVRRRESGPELRVLGRWILLRFAAPNIVIDEAGVLSRFPIEGGWLARAPGGSITFAQSSAPVVGLRATIDGFFPRLRGALYRHVQQRIHTSVSRRYFRRLLEEEAR